jgi:hypothetical protein
MQDEHNPQADAAVGAAMMAAGEDRQQKLQKAANDLRVEMEQSAQQIRELILAQPPSGLLGYLWAQLFLGALKHQEKDGSGGPDKDLIKQFQFVLEYVHAVWSCHAGQFVAGSVDEAKAAQLLKECDELSSKAMFYAMASSQINKASEFGEVSSSVEFHAKSAWTLIRGHRYQVLEDEFFRFVLAPHNEALKKAYGVDAPFIAEGIQAITDSIRGGYSDAVAKIWERMEQCHAVVEGENITLDVAIEKIKALDPDFAAEMDSGMRDLFYGGICNLSRHTKLPVYVLEDLAWRACHAPCWPARNRHVSARGVTTGDVDPIRNRSQLRL